MQPTKTDSNRPNSFPYSVVLFDFDGTLADSYPAITASVNHTRERFQMAPLETDEVKRFVGRGPQHLLGNTVPGVPVDQAYQIYKDHHPTVLSTGTVLLPGTWAVLEYLHGNRVKQGICSNKPRMFTEQLVDFLKVAPFFQLILGPEDVKNRKPAPDMLVEAIRRAEVSREEVLYIGDMSVDIQTGRGAGVQVWAVTTGSETSDEVAAAKPDRLFSSMDEVLGAMKSF